MHVYNLYCFFFFPCRLGGILLYTCYILYHVNLFLKVFNGRLVALLPVMVVVVVVAARLFHVLTVRLHRELRGVCRCRYFSIVSQTRKPDGSSGYGGLPDYIIASPCFVRALTTPKNQTRSDTCNTQGP